MQSWPLVTGTLLRHAARHHGRQTLVSVGVDGVRHEQTLLQTYERAIRLALALERLSEPRAVVASLAWNTHRHAECWHAVQSSGRVLHTLNPRLGLDALTFIATEGEATWLVVDTDLVALAEQLCAAVSRLRGIIVLASREQMPRSSSGTVLCYEDLLAAESPPANLSTYEWAGQDENAAASLCFTSGTTGNPKGVCYTHRSQMLHAMTVGQPDVCNLSSVETLLVIVPIFHANGWMLVRLLFAISISMCDSLFACFTCRWGLP